MALPNDFLEFVRSYPQLRILENSLNETPETSIRWNPAKMETPANAERVPWCENGAYLAERPKFTLDPAMHQGAYYVQDASSMAICAVLKQLAVEPVLYLDACAAPGGKTTAAVATLPHGSFVVANEFDRRRADILAENVAKWGDPYTMVTCGDTARFSKLRDTFDIIAVDAPCSGEGMMRKDVQAVEQWSAGLTRQCAELQRTILANVWPALKPGGFLVYSTCTFNTDENERNLQFLVGEMGAEPITINALESIPDICGAIEGELPCYRFIPGRIKGEGLFLAVVRKPEGKPSECVRQKPGKKGAGSPLLKEASVWMKGNLHLTAIGDEIYALPEEMTAVADKVSASTFTLQTGVHVATAKGRDLVPAHELALSLALNREAFPQAEIDLDNALRFLRKEPVELPQQCKRGYVLLVYKGLPLGFVKNLGNRTNNLLPKNWRIRN